VRRQKQSFGHSHQRHPGDQGLSVGCRRGEGRGSQLDAAPPPAGGGTPAVLRLVTWNINRQPEAWRTLLEGGIDIALLQEAVPPPADVADRVELDVAPPWRTAGKGSRRP